MKVLTNALKGSRTIVFFDFEGTQFSQEIVALGAIKVDIDEKNQIMKKLNKTKDAQTFLDYYNKIKENNI